MSISQAITVAISLRQNLQNRPSGCRKQLVIERSNPRRQLFGFQRMRRRAGIVGQSRSR